MEQEDLKTVLQDFYTQLRDNYRCESPTWVMHPNQYDRYTKKIEDGELPPDAVAWFQANVRRGEYME
jgi:hypothetical protein